RLGLASGRPRIVGFGTGVPSRRKEKRTMTSIAKYLAAPVMALAMTATSARAAQPLSEEPAKLSDGELDQVTAGDGCRLDLHAFVDVMLKTIAVTVNVSNVPINAAVAVQANALGTAAQTATVQALQSVTQLQTLPVFH